MGVSLGSGNLSIRLVSLAQIKNLRSTRLVFSTVGRERSRPLGRLRTISDFKNLPTCGVRMADSLRSAPKKPSICSKSVSEV